MSELAMAPDFKLLNENDREVALGEMLKDGPLLLVFYPGDFTPVCTIQLCSYRDNINNFGQIGIKIIGISKDSPESHRRFKEKYNLPFSLLSDPKSQVAKAYGCQSAFMLGMVSRAVFIVGQKGEILYKHVEPVSITRRKPDELMDVVRDLKANGKL